MKRVVLYVVLMVFMLPSCSKTTGSTVRAARPTYHHRFYDRKKDKHVKRVKMLRVKN